RFVVGSDAGYRDERPAGEVAVDDLFIDRTEVTNAQFGRFVEATGYRTLAERHGSAPVFSATDPERSLSWWRLASAHRLDPDGQGRAPAPGEPVVQIALEDGFAGRAPVGCFPSNAFGLFDAVGNVWEWTREPWFVSHAEAQAATPAARAGAG